MFHIHMLVITAIRWKKKHKFFLNFYLKLYFSLFSSSITWFLPVKHVCTQVLVLPFVVPRSTKAHIAHLTWLKSVRRGKVCCQDTAFVWCAQYSRHARPHRSVFSLRVRRRSRQAGKEGRRRLLTRSDQFFGQRKHTKSDIVCLFCPNLSQCP